MDSASLPRAALAAACLCAAVASVRGADEDMAFLLDGVGRISAPGVPGPLCVFGEKAMPVVVGESGENVREAVVAATRLGAGRAVAFGHDGYFDAGTLATADTGRFMLNAVRWAGGAGPDAKGSPRVAVLHQPGLLGFLREDGVPAEELGGNGWRDRLKGFQVLCVNPVRLTAGADAAAVSEFAMHGGGLILVGLGWGWQQLNPAKDLVKHHPASHLLAPTGIVWADGTLERTAEGGHAAGGAPPALAHAARALDAILAHASGERRLGPAGIRQAVHVVSRAARSLAEGNPLFMPRLRGLERERRADIVPTARENLFTMYVFDKVCGMSPKYDGVTVRAMKGEEVKISGADIIEGWRREADGSWSAPLAAEPKRVLRDGRPWSGLSHDGAARRIALKTGGDPRLHVFETVLRERCIDLVGKKDVKIEEITVVDTLRAGAANP